MIADLLLFDRLRIEDTYSDTYTLCWFMSDICRAADYMSTIRKIASYFD